MVAKEDAQSGTSAHCTGIDQSGIKRISGWPLYTRSSSPQRADLKQTKGSHSLLTWLNSAPEGHSRPSDSQCATYHRDRQDRRHGPVEASPLPAPVASTPGLALPPQSQCQGCNSRSQKYHALRHRSTSTRTVMVVWERDQVRA
ncbi:hypothetical protein BD414DRAFT_483697 [Trametes punicea]|nr:hypothetical protein BD414DRAFT_483697 [Trametes punicea]